MKSNKFHTLGKQPTPTNTPPGAPPLSRLQRFMPESRQPSHDFDHQCDNIPFLPNPSDQHPSGSESLRRPLIDLATNEWKNKLHLDEDDPEYHEKEVWREPPLIALFKAPKMRRLLIRSMLITLFGWLSWRYGIRPRWEEQRVLTKSLEDVKRQGKEGRLPFGNNVTPTFKDLIQVRDLDKRLVPQPAGHGEKRRLIIVGDVHGCKDELLKLLNKVSFHPSHSHLILTGDLIAKGPSSPGVVDIALQTHASCVRGNHEDRMLLAWDAYQSRISTITGTPDSDSQQDNLQHIEEELTTQHGNNNLTLAKQFTHSQIHYLRQCPVILRIPSIPGLGPLAIVHAGLVPGVPLERMDPYYAMNMRSIDPETFMPYEKRKYMLWEKVWNHYQKGLEKEERVTVVYGHDSKRGLNVRRWSKGLDSGCVSGGRLSALVVERVGGEVRMRVESVRCGKRGNK